MRPTDEREKKPIGYGTRNVTNSPVDGTNTSSESVLTTP